jgi:hypothetical protein
MSVKHLVHRTLGDAVLARMIALPGQTRPWAALQSLPAERPPRPPCLADRV